MLSLKGTQNIHEPDPLTSVFSPSFFPLWGGGGGGVCVDVIKGTTSWPDQHFLLIPFNKNEKVLILLFLLGLK